MRFGGYEGYSCYSDWHFCVLPSMGSLHPCVMLNACGSHICGGMLSSFLKGEYGVYLKVAGGIHKKDI